MISITQQVIINLFRIIQEFVNNALKHSGCNEIHITLYATKEEIELTINDNGKGFDASTRKKGHYGLDNMIARVEQLHLVLNIESEIGKGTVVKIRQLVNGAILKLHFGC